MKTIQQVWELLDKGETVYWKNTSYKVYISPQIENNEYQTNNFSNRNGMILSIRCISNYFGSIIEEKELPTLFTKKEL
jgi:hypothetical protein